MDVKRFLVIFIVLDKLVLVLVGFFGESLRVLVEIGFLG